MQTSTSKSFIEILANEIRDDLRQEIEAEVLSRYGISKADSASATGPLPSAAVHAAGRLEMWLASNMGRTTFARTQAATRSYKTQPRTAGASQARARAAGSTLNPTDEAKKTAPKTVARMFSAETAEQLCALELLTRESGTALETAFTADQLKTAWRKAALKTHPDRFAGEDQIKQMRMSILFREVCEAYELLANAIDNSQAAA